MQKMLSQNMILSLNWEREEQTTLSFSRFVQTRLAEAVSDSDMAFRIHLVLHRLDEPYKEVFQLRVFGELSFSQIAAIFGKTESWARVTYHRAKLKIQERME